MLLTILSADPHRLAVLVTRDRPKPIVQQSEGVAGIEVFSGRIGRWDKTRRKILAKHQNVRQIDLLLPEPFKNTNDLINRWLVVSALASEPLYLSVLDPNRAGAKDSSASQQRRMLQFFYFLFLAEDVDGTVPVRYIERGIIFEIVCVTKHLCITTSSWDVLFLSSKSHRQADSAASALGRVAIVGLQSFVLGNQCTDPFQRSHPNSFAHSVLPLLGGRHFCVRRHRR
jgi:hypothetical protein